MGLCCLGICVCSQSLAVAQSQNRPDSHPISILLLGTPNSGKSTIIKLCRELNGEPFTRQERQIYKVRILRQCIGQMQMTVAVRNDIIFLISGFTHDTRTTVQNQGKSLRIPDGIQRQISLYIEGFDVFLSPNACNAAKGIQNLHQSANEFSDDIVATLKTLWNEPTIKAMYDRRDDREIVGSTVYFWDMLDTLNDPNWLPESNDIDLVSDMYISGGMQYFLLH